MKKYPRSATVDPTALAGVQAIPDERKATSWAKPENDEKPHVQRFQKDVMDDGMVIQDSCCAWCGLPLGKKQRRRAFRDHIAPKHIHGEWTYLADNIVICCDFCNSSTCKGKREAIKVKAEKNYKKCEFFLVHPYFDEQEVHFDMEDGLIVRARDEKGLWTIETFRLADGSVLMHKAKAELGKEREALLPADQVLLDAALEGGKLPVELMQK